MRWVLGQGRHQVCPPPTPAQYVQVAAEEAEVAAEVAAEEAVPDLNSTHQTAH